MTEIAKPARVTREEQPVTVDVGQWYWYKRGPRWKGDRGEHWLGCVTRLGSNYAKITHANGGSERVLLEAFDQFCTFEPDAEGQIKRRIEECRHETDRLLDEVRKLTATLALTPSEHAADETQSLARVNSTGSFKDYGKALVKAKEKTLPDLFKEIKESNEEMAQWMRATMLPLKAQEGRLGYLTKAIKTRIENVEIYAGLVEQVRPCP